MEFRLTYEGDLASARRSNAQHQHDIRRSFHPQLKRFWEQDIYLANAPAFAVTKFHAPAENGYRTRIQQLANYFRRGPYSFVPLITDDQRVLCHLDVLFLRPGPPGHTLNAGDIDNRIKTLIDALKIPEIVPGNPQEGESPFFVLLQDDRLVTRLSVETDTLLQPTGPDAGVQDARLVITVRFSFPSWGL